LFKTVFRTLCSIENILDNESKTENVIEKQDSNSNENIANTKSSNSKDLEIIDKENISKIASIEL
jgi:hypothetical protein